MRSFLLPDSKAPSRGRHQRRSFSRLFITAALVLGLGAAAFTTQHFYGRLRLHHNPVARLLIEKETLLQRLHDWNEHAKDAGIPAKERLALADSTASTACPTLATGSSNAVQARTGSQPTEKRFQMMSPADIEKENPEFVAQVRQHAKNNEIMLTLANGVMICQNKTICWWDGGNILESFLTILNHTKVTNYVIGVLDDETDRYLAGRNINTFRVKLETPSSQEGSHPANKVSTLKYHLLMQLISLGYNTLITDMDLVYMHNPFDHLHRDADIEVQTDGFDDMAYGVLDGVHDPSMGWGAGGLYMKTFTANVGCMWVRASQQSFTLMRQVSDHLSKQRGWDQQVFNEYLMQPSHGDFSNAYATLRILDYMKFMNSKIFFKSRRDLFIPGATSKAKTPIMVHFNYHPDKHKRMLCIMDRYYYGKVDACDKFPVGSDKP